MRRIELHHTNDLDRLRNLVGNEYIFVKVFHTFAPSIIRGIDLKKFSGTIDVDFEKGGHFPCVVKVDENATRRFLFMNVEKAEILMPRHLTYSVKYQEISNHFFFFSIGDFRKVQENVDGQQQIVLHFQDDVCLESFPLDFLENYSGKIRIIGDDHQMFLKNGSAWKDFLDNHRVTVENFSIVLVDQIIFVKTAKDLEKISNLTTGKIAVSICNDIKNFRMESIQLSKFRGSLYILGHKKRIQDVCIRSFNKTHGFISSISPASDLKIYNLSFQNVKSEHLGECKEAGVFLGKRGFVSDEVQSHFVPGQILFSNCSVKNARLPYASSIGTFVGDGDFEIEILDSFDFQVFDGIGNQIRSFIGNAKFSYFSSFYSNWKSELEDYQEQLRLLKERQNKLKRVRD